MDQHETDEQLMDYLYGELSPAARSDFEYRLKNDPKLADEVKSFQNLRQVCQRHLLDFPLPIDLRAKVFARVEAKTSWWQRLFAHGFLRPVSVAAFTVLLTLGVVYQFRTPGIDLAKKETGGPVGSELSQRDFLTAAQASRPQWPRPMWRPQPGLGNGLVSLASYGSPMMPQPYGDAASYDIRSIDQDAEMAIAQFAHQQAMRMRAMGDYKGAAQEFAVLIKKFPNYPHVFAAAAQRIDCLFRSNQKDLARIELKWLNQQSPFLAQAVGQRWGLTF